MSKKKNTKNFDEPQDEIVSFETPIEALGRYMASLGFKSRPPKTRGTLEYSKLYPHVTGRVAQVVSVIELDESGLTPQGPQVHYITIQLALRPDKVSVECPAFAKLDLMRLNAYCTQQENPEVSTVVCSVCGVIVDEYVSAEDENTCADCMERFSNG